MYTTSPSGHTEHPFQFLKWNLIANFTLMPVYFVVVIMFWNTPHFADETPLLRFVRDFIIRRNLHSSILLQRLVWMDLANMDFCWKIRNVTKLSTSILCHDIGIVQLRWVVRRRSLEVDNCKISSIVREQGTESAEYAALSDLNISAAALDSCASIVVLRSHQHCLRNIFVVVRRSHQHCLLNIYVVVLRSHQHCLRNISDVVLKNLISIIFVIFPTKFFPDFFYCAHQHYL